MEICQKQFSYCMIKSQENEGIIIKCNDAQYVQDPNAYETNIVQIRMNKENNAY